MPFAAYAKMTPQGLDSIVAYLHSLKPIEHKVRQNRRADQIPLMVKRRPVSKGVVSLGWLRRTPTNIARRVSSDCTRSSMSRFSARFWEGPAYAIGND